MLYRCGIENKPDPQTQEKTVEPKVGSQVIYPDSGYYLSKVTVSSIYYSEVDNSSGGKTVTIGKT